MYNNCIVSRAVTIVAAAALLAAAVSTAQAQLGAPGAPQPGAMARPAGPPPPMAINDPRNILHLTPDQQKKAAAINQEFVSAVQDLSNNKALTDADKRAQFTSAQSTAEKHLNAILTPSQRTDLKNRQSEQKKYMAGVQTAVTRVRAVDKQFRASLSAKQLKKLQQMHDASYKQISAVEHNKALTPLAAGQQEQAIQKSFQAEVRAMLTPKQNSMLSDEFRYQDEARALQKLAQSTGL